MEGPPIVDPNFVPIHGAVIRLMSNKKIGTHAELAGF